MKITPLPRTGTSAKFIVTTKRGEFMISLSRTLYEEKWGLGTGQEQLDAATKMAEAIVGRHDPALPFKLKYIFADHNTEPTVKDTVAYLNKYAI
jgi:hypothetical protein